MSKNQSGQASLSFFLLVAAVGLIVYLLVTSSFSFKNSLLSNLYYKTPSQAFDDPNPASSSAGTIPTETWQENWESNNLTNWYKISFDCSSLTPENSLNIRCTKGFITSKPKFSKDSPIIIIGSFSAKNTDLPPGASIGLASKENQNPFFQLSAGSSVLPSKNSFILKDYQEGQTVNFKLVLTKIKGKHLVYYYLNNSPEPAEKSEIDISENPSLFIKCTGDCTFGPITVSGVKVN